jgi:hypothetical protein
VLSALLRVLDAKEVHERGAREEREARAASAPNVETAIRHGENTWERLHAHFPESQWPELGRELERGQREERFHRPSNLTFQLGARKGRWTAAGGYP